MRAMLVTPRHELRSLTLERESPPRTQEGARFVDDKLRTMPRLLGGVGVESRLLIRGGFRRELDGLYLNRAPDFAPVSLSGDIVQR